MSWLIDLEENFKGFTVVRAFGDDEEEWAPQQIVKINSIAVNIT
jgi:hypothetical protein